MNRQTISLLGSTGSIGVQTLDVARHLKIGVSALSAGSNVELLLAQCAEFKPQTVCIGEAKYKELKSALSGVKTEILCGDEGNCHIAASDESETIVNAIGGIRGLKPTVAAAKAGKKIAFANKETLVAGGTIVTDEVKKHGAVLLPVDSEHSAISQCLQCGREVKKLLLTGSGGPFLGKSSDFLKTVTPEMAVKHPKWRMGKKISVDSASLMNKGLELIEAAYLFDISPENIQVLIHPQSTVHSLVEFCDNSVIAQLGVADMRLCIQYALTYPDRCESLAAELDLAGVNLSFENPDEKTFPLLALARRAVNRGGNIPAAMNGANEEAVALFLDGRISFPKLFSSVISATENAVYICNPTLSDILETDTEARRFVREAIKRSDI